MLQKITNGLLSPKRIANYVHESFGKSFLYLLMLVLFLMIPTVTNILVNSTLSSNAQNIIKTAFLQEKIPFFIEDGKLRNKDGNTEAVYVNDNLSGYKIVISENNAASFDSLKSIVIFLNEDSVDIVMAGAVMRLFQYSDYSNLNGLDINGANGFENIEFWNTVFSIVDNQLDNYFAIRFAINVFYNIFYWIVWLMILACILGLVARMRTLNFLRFGDALKISIYNMTPFVFCAIISEFFNIGIFIYLGYIITFIFNTMTVNEILKQNGKLERRDDSNDL